MFLAPDEASFVTGTELVIDGGFIAKWQCRWPMPLWSRKRLYDRMVGALGRGDGLADAD